MAFPMIAFDFTYEYEGQTLKYSTINEVYDFKGTYVGNPGSDLRPGIYIIRRGNKTWKSG